MLVSRILYINQHLAQISIQSPLQKSIFGMFERSRTFSTGIIVWKSIYSLHEVSRYAVFSVLYFAGFGRNMEKYGPCSVRMREKMDQKKLLIFMQWFLEHRAFFKLPIVEEVPRDLPVTCLPKQFLDTIRMGILL